jgi:hypothetical protein
VNWWGAPGPGSPSEIASNIAGAYVQASVAAGLLLVSLAIWLASRNRLLWPVACASLVVVHPAWAVAVQANDGGRQKIEMAYVFTAVAAVIVLVQVGQLIWDRCRQPRPC